MFFFVSPLTLADDDYVSFAKSLPANNYDKSLPSIPTEQWLTSILPRGIIAVWGNRVTDCGEQTGDPAIDRERDMLLCVEVELKKKDIRGVRALNELAFGQPLEADIVDKLRNNCADLLSLVATENDKIVGHILFSPAEIEGPQGVIKGMGLAPMAVLPELQRRGIGTQLVNTGIEELRKLQCPFIIVLGHHEYYPSFGFERASSYRIKCRWEGIPDEAFMILWLDKTKAGQVSGVAKYREEFDEAV